MQKNSATELRKRELTLIHLAKAQLGMADDAYRAMLFAVARVNSAADLDFAGRKRVMEHLQNCGFRKKSSGTGGGRHAPQIAKVRALLIAMGRLPDSYADSIAMRMWQIKRFVWLDAQQLHALIAALAIEQQRKAG